MTYEYAVSDTYYIKYSKEILKTKLAGLKYNTLRLYDVNPEETYDIFMKDMAKINVYVIISVSPDTIHITENTDTPPSIEHYPRMEKI